MRNKIKLTLMSFFISILFFCNLNANTLIVYFSCGGNTKTAANIIKNITDADIFEIKTKVPYPKNYNELLNYAQKEIIDNRLPQLERNINNVSNYDTVILCYPNWGGTIPQAVKQLLLTHDFSDKKIAPLCTHGGGGMGRSLNDIKKLCPNSTILKHLDIYGSSVKSSENNIKSWIQDIV